MAKRCGGCRYFTKMGNQHCSGLCERFDASTKADAGRTCQAFKPLKYSRLTTTAKVDLNVK